MKRTIEIEDSLMERRTDAIEEVKAELLRYLESYPEEYVDGSEEPPISLDKLDNDGSIHEIVDGCVPIYTSEIEATWFLHRSKLEQAYEDSGIGEDAHENNGMTAIYCYLDQEVNEWYHDHAGEFCQYWYDEERPRDPEVEEV